jgi:hypothetical protein
MESYHRPIAVSDYFELIQSPKQEVTSPASRCKASSCHDTIVHVAASRSRAFFATPYDRQLVSFVPHDDPDCDGNEHQALALSTDSNNNKIELTTSQAAKQGQQINLQINQGSFFFFFFLIDY